MVRMRGGDIDREFRLYRRTGRPRHLARVFDRLAPELLPLAAHLAPKGSEAEDLIQLTFLQAIESAEEYDPQRPLRPWLVGILVNRARREARRRRHQDVASDPLTEASEPLDRLADREQIEVVAHELASLPQPYRHVLNLRIVHGLQPRQIADSLGLPLETVKTQLQRGLKILRRRVPRELATALLAMPITGQGLAAVRTAVLERAAVVEPAAGSVASGLTSSPWLGLMTIKKTWCLAAALFGALGLIWFTHDDSEARSEPGSELEFSSGQAASSQQEAHAPRTAPEFPARTDLADPTATLDTDDTNPRQNALTIQVLEAGGGPAGLGHAVRVLPLGAVHPDLEAGWWISDRNGRIHLTGIAPGRVEARLLRGGENAVELSTADRAVMQLRLQPGFTVVGTVVDADRRPVSKAGIWLSEKWSPTSGRVVTHCDEFGRFEISNVREAHYLGARHPAFQPSALKQWAGSPGDRFEVEIRLGEPGESLELEVVDASDTVVEDALVRIEPQPDSQAELSSMRAAPYLQRSDVNGRVRLEQMPKGEVSVLIRKAGFAPWQGVFATDSTRGPHRVRLSHGAQAIGTVVDQSGQPVVRARIQVGPESDLRFPFTLSDAQGRFELVDLPVGPVELFAIEERIGTATLETTLRIGEQLRWDPVLEAAPSVHGRILDHQGRPLAGWKVMLIDPANRELVFRAEPSDEAGRFRVQGLQADVGYRLWLQDTSGWRSFPRLTLESVFPDPSERLLQVGDPSLSCEVVGMLQSSDKAPLEGARIGLWHHELRIWRSYPVEGSSGHFRITGLAPGTIDLQASSRHHPEVELDAFTLVAGDRIQLETIVLPRAAHLSLQATHSEGLQLERLEARLLDLERDSEDDLEAQGLELRSKPLHPGRYRVQVWARDAHAFEQELELLEGEQRRLDVVLYPAHSLDFVFDERSGESPARWVSVTITNAADEPVWQRRWVARENGVLSVNCSLPVGRYHLQANSQSGEFYGHAFSVAAGSTPERTIHLQPGE